MKINMWKLLIAGLFASAALAGCEDNRNNFMVDDTLSFVNEEQYAGVSVYNGKYEFAILKNGKGQQSAKALLSVSETALAEYNAANGTNYAVLPANCYKLSSSTIGFSDGDTRKFVEVTWDDAAIFALGEGTEYAIPLELTTVNDALAVDANRNVKIINPKRASIGMEKELATPFHPTATHEEITFDGNIVLDNAITTMDLTVNYAIDNSLVPTTRPTGRTTWPRPKGSPGWTPPARRSQQARRRPSSRARSTPTSCSRAATSISWATCSCRCASPPRRWTVSPSPPRSCMSPSRWTRN